MSNHHSSGCGCSCGSTNPIEVLKGEHRVIESVLESMERAAARPAVDMAFFRDAIDFLRNFADGCHHAKEEDQLFPRLESLGVPRDGGPIGCMLDEHTQGRALIQRMIAALDQIERGVLGAADDLRAAAGLYIGLLRKHIWKEDHVLFEMANRALSHDARRDLVAAFDSAEEAKGGMARHQQYIELASRLHVRSHVEPQGAQA